MLRKIAKRMTNNLGLKILAALFAVVMWLVVLNIDDPIKGKTVTTSVTFENESYITSMGKCYEVLGGSSSNTVSFYFTAQRSIYEKISGSDFTATADLKRIEYDEETGTYRVPVSIVPNKNANSVNITTKQQYLELTLEDYISTQFPIKANTAGTVADGCALGDVAISSTNVIKVSGPASIVNTITSAAATINVEGMATDIVDSVVPVLYDADGNNVDITKLKLSLQTVSISAQILNTKDVSILFETKGKVAEGYRLKSVTCKPTTVRIKGKTDVLNTIDNVTVPEEVLDITDLSESFEKTVDITSYLPSGISLVISSEAKVDVEVAIEEVETRTYQISASKLKVTGLTDEYKASFADEYAEISVTASVEALDELEDAGLKASVDAQLLTAGTHRVEVLLDVDEELYDVSRSYVTLVLESSVEAGDDVETDPEENIGDSTTVEGTVGAEDTSDDEPLPDEESEMNTIISENEGHN